MTPEDRAVLERYWAKGRVRRFCIEYVLTMAFLNDWGEAAWPWNVRRCWGMARPIKP